MSSLGDSLSQKEYLKKYLSEDSKDTRKKRKKKTSAPASTLKRSQIIDDDIDLKSMRPLDDDEVELYQMDEDAPQIAGIIDERPADVKAQEHYNSKRWKVFGGEDGVNVLDSMDKNQQSVSDKLSVMSKELGKGSTKSGNSDRMDQNAKKDWDTLSETNIKSNQKESSSKNRASSKKYVDSDESPSQRKNQQSSSQHDSDLSPPRFDRKGSVRGKVDSDSSSQSKNLPKTRDKRDRSSDSDASPPRRDSRKDISKRSEKSPSRKEQKRTRQGSDSDPSPPRKTHQKRDYKNNSDSDASPPRRRSRKDISKRSNRSPPNRDHKRTPDNTPPRKDTGKRTKYKSDSDNSPPRKEKLTSQKYKSDSDPSPPRRREMELKNKFDARNASPRRSKRKSFSGSDSSSPRRDRRKPPFKRNYSPQNVKRKHSPRSITPPIRLEKPLPLKIAKSSKNLSPRLSRRDLMNEKNVRRRFSDSDDSPPRRRSNSFRLDEGDLDESPPRKSSVSKKEKPLKKALYKPNDSSSSDETSRSRSKKMKITLDGKQAGLQDAKQLRKELSDLRMKEDAMFSKMDASVSGVGAAPIKRDRKTGKVRDLEKEKEEQKEKEAKASVVNEKYYKWGKGLKQVEDAAERAADVIKEMNKPLARYKDDEDLDNFLKAQEREGDPMLDFIKQKQKEATPLGGTKPLYQGSFNPNRFGIRPGHRWDGVVRSNGYEKEWFTHKNARKARDEEAYKWSTSDM